jgi:mono/diheme cytochrome c family protein
MKRAVAYLLLIAACVLASAGWGAQKEEKNHTKKNAKVHLISSVQGADIFHAYCATCHGNSGKGDGPIASVLDTPVGDLTTITQRNGGIFPGERVRAIIVGEQSVKAHGPREMPIWGPIFRENEKKSKSGKLRLQNVTDYVESLQN